MCACAGGKPTKAQRGALDLDPYANREIRSLEAERLLGKGHADEACGHESQWRCQRAFCEWLRTIGVSGAVIFAPA